ncbi:MAG TPA: tRNA pseudouridine(55) synthase TruB [Polyangiaceae bacterium]
MVRLSPDGVLVVDKPVGPTSHDVVGDARRLYGTRAVGHAGTLDPMASGVLVLLFGEATKLSNYLTLESKRYAARVQLGLSTTTDDAWGDVLEQRSWTEGAVTHERLEAALAAERARTAQIPPPVSAIKVAGQRAHKLVRAGQPPELEPRSVCVHELTLRGVQGAAIDLEAHVSKGYFVRALARDLGRHLGFPAHLSALRRIASGSFSIAEAHQWPPAEPLPLLSLASAARRALPALDLTDEGELRARQGKRLLAEHFGGGELTRASEPGAWFAPDGALVALGQREGDEWVVLRGFVRSD